jgi:hypothetical protein
VVKNHEDKKEQVELELDLIDLLFEDTVVLLLALDKMKLISKGQSTKR